MTEHENLRHKQIQSIRMFLKDNSMDAWTLAKLAKELCCCGTCGFFVQHYTIDGKPLDWGHCCKGNIQHSKKISTASCGFWTDGVDDGNEILSD